MNFDRLFDPAFLARVDALSLKVAQASRGARLAGQRSKSRGQGSDFADFRPYVAGDDLRAIDWNIYRRLGRPFVRVFEEQRELPVYLLVDVSASMFLEASRIEAALRSTLAIAAIALGQHDAVTLLPFAETVTVQVRSASGRGNIVRIARQLADHAPAGRTALADAIDRVGGMKLRQGLLVVVSDFFDPVGVETVTERLSSLPHQILIVQVARAADADPALDPAMDGDLLVDDGEGDAAVEMTMTPDLIARYRAAYHAFQTTLVEFAERRGAGMLRIDADRDVLDQIGALSRGGVLAL